MLQCARVCIFCHEHCVKATWLALPGTFKPDWYRDERTFYDRRLAGAADASTAPPNEGHNTQESVSGASGLHKPRRTKSQQPKTKHIFGTSENV